MAKARREDNTRLRTKAGEYVAECTFCYCPEGCACDGEGCGCGTSKVPCRHCSAQKPASGDRLCDKPAPGRGFCRYPPAPVALLAKVAAKPRKSSGPNIPEMDRRTVAVKLRLSRDVAEQLRELAMLSRTSLSAIVAELVTSSAIGKAPAFEQPAARDDNGKLLPPCAGGAPAPKERATNGATHILEGQSYDGGPKVKHDVLACGRRTKPSAVRHIGRALVIANGLSDDVTCKRCREKYRLYCS